MYKNQDEKKETLLFLNMVGSLVLLIFGRKPDTMNGHLKPYNPIEAADAVDDLLKRIEKKSE